MAYSSLVVWNLPQPQNVITNSRIAALVISKLFLFRVKPGLLQGRCLMGMIERCV